MSLFPSRFGRSHASASHKSRLLNESLAQDANYWLQHRELTADQYGDTLSNSGDFPIKKKLEQFDNYLEQNARLARMINGATELGPDPYSLAIYGRIGLLHRVGRLREEVNKLAPHQPRKETSELDVINNSERGIAMEGLAVRLGRGLNEALPYRSFSVERPGTPNHFKIGRRTEHGFAVVSIHKFVSGQIDEPTPANIATEQYRLSYRKSDLTDMTIGYVTVGAVQNNAPSLADATTVLELGEQIFGSPETS